jgi:prevent-host-death family protein
MGSRLTKLVIGHTLLIVKVVNVAEAKAHLSELVERAAEGEEIIVARAGKPRAKLVPLGDVSRRLRVPGKRIGKYRASKDFDAPLPNDLLDLFEK